MNDFGMEEVETALKLLKNSKTANIDGMLLEFLKHMGIKEKFG